MMGALGNWGWPIIGAPIWFMALHTRAPGAHAATCSAPEVVCPISSAVKSGVSGLVQSMSTLSLRSPHALTASLVPCHGVHSTTTSLAAAAASLVAVGASRSAYL